jgi:tetratricopeptide (TPR) repeat protein
LQTLEHFIEKDFSAMENQQANQSNLPNILDIVSVVGAVGGTVASLAFNQVAFATVPLSLSVALNVFNRRQMMNEIAQQQQGAIAHLSGQVSNVQNSLTEQLNQLHQKSVAQLERKAQTQQTTFENLSGQLGELQQLVANLTQENQQLKTSTETIEEQHKQMEAVVLELREIQTVTQKMSSNANSVNAEAYFERGLSQERIGDKQQAIEDYTAAIHLNSNYAQAYHQRGMLNHAVGHRKKAIDDLRKAAKLYFEQGDIENYETTRDLAKELYELPSTTANNGAAASSSNTLLVGGLFS